jgi:hypothetical protein
MKKLILCAGIAMLAFTASNAEVVKSSAVKNNIIIGSDDWMKSSE